MTKKQAKERAYRTLGQYLTHVADSTEIFDNGDLSDADRDKVLAAAREIAEGMSVRADNLKRSSERAKR